MSFHIIVAMGMLILSHARKKTTIVIYDVARVAKH
jgi:hypothetical protein